MALTDRLGRPLRDLRISLTDRCNFRCGYCMPRDVFGADHVFLPSEHLLSFDEIERAVRVFVKLGVTKIRLTGGEPLLRPGVTDLVARLAAVPGLEDLALTTNGTQLAEHAMALKQAGLQRLNVSLDSLDDATFRAAADVRLPLQRVLDGIAAASAAGFTGLKLNTVVRRGVNDTELADLAAFARTGGHQIRFIEYMDVGATNGWRLADVVPAAEIIAQVSAAFPAEPIGRQSAEVATRFRYLDGQGEFGVVASVTRPFCRTCVRARLSAVGELYTCLFASSGTDLRAALRDGEDALTAAVTQVWQDRADRYSELRSASTAPRERVEMSYIGG